MSIARQVTSRLFHRAAPSPGDDSLITDRQLARTLGVYAGMVDRVLDQPEHWLAVEDTDHPRNVAARAWDRVRRVASGEQHPGSPQWDQQPLADRTDWWLRRISLTAGTAAATPRLAGLLADRVPLQAALGASASGLAVCAVARENGMDDPEQWVPLLAQVIFERELRPADTTATTVPDASTSEDELATAASEVPDAPTSRARRIGAGGQRGAKAMWRLARTLLELQNIFDERPHGGFLPRVVARLPVVGVAGGWLDERGAIRVAARETQKLVGAPAA